MPKSVFERVEEQLKKRNQDENIEATDFELLTATAYQIFEEEEVQTGIVETGMGGRLDATNVLKHKEMAVITRIGLDHQEFLGDTLTQITTEKCGIFKPNSLVLYDTQNSPEVISEIRRQTYRRHAMPLKLNWYYYPNLDYAEVDYKSLFRRRFGHNTYQEHNAILAYQAACVFLRHLSCQPDGGGAEKPIDYEAISKAILDTEIPGRLQMVSLRPIVGERVECLVDGAHNPQAIAELKTIIPERYPQYNAEFQHVSWILAFSEGKSLEEMITLLAGVDPDNAHRSCLLRPGHTVAAVEFGPVDGMPWKKAISSDEIANYIRNSPHTQGVMVESFGSQLLEALRWAATVNHPPSTVVMVLGSLYLASDLLRLLREHGEDLTSWSGSHNANIVQEARHDSSLVRRHLKSFNRRRSQPNERQRKLTVPGKKDKSKTSVRIPIHKEPAKFSATIRKVRDQRWSNIEILKTNR